MKLVEPLFQRPTLRGRRLIAPFTVEEEEVKEEVWGCDGNKSSGPDGFNFNFIKNSWEVVKDDILGFFEEFHVNVVMPKAITASFLPLMPKKENPQS